MLHGIDVSYAQGNPNWDELKATGIVDFAVARASYGTDPADDDGPIFQRNHDECKRVGIPFGAYHFFLFDQDGAAQADHFLEQINGRYGQIRPTIDIEEGSAVNGNGGSLEDRIANVVKFNGRIQSVLKCQPIIYTNADTWATYFNGTDAFCGHTLWIASYGRQPGSPVLPSGFTTWAMHQYTSGLTLTGIDGFVDADVLNGNDLSAVSF